MAHYAGFVPGRLGAIAVRDLSLVECDGFKKSRADTQKQRNYCGEKMSHVSFVSIDFG